MAVARHRLRKDALQKLSPEQQERLQPYIEAFQAHLKRNPLLNYQPHPKQVQFHASHEPIKAFLGGNRSGKTTAGILDDLIQAVDEDDLPEHLKPYKKWQPPFYCRIIAPDFIVTMQSVIFQKLKDWAPKDQLKGGSFEAAYDKQLRVLHFKNGSWFQFLTFEQDLDKHMGVALHRVHYDEEPPLPIRRENSMRLIDFGGDELFTMTPLSGMTWMYKSIYEPWTKGTLADSILIEVDMDDNPHLDARTKARALADLSPEERRARKEGKFVHFGGMIYDEFSSGTHVVPQIDGIPDNWMVYVGIDPGLRYLAAAVFVAIDQYDNMIVFDEIGVRGATIKEMASEIKRTLAKWNVTPRMTVIDPAAMNKSHQTGRSDQMEYLDQGIVTVPGQNAVRPGIDNVKRRLLNVPVDGNSEFTKQSLVVCANCPQLIDEFAMYRWKSEGRTDGDQKEEPIKTNDHLLDALRYVCMARPLPGKDNVELDPIQRLYGEDARRVARRRNRANTQMGGPGMFA